MKMLFPHYWLWDVDSKEGEEGRIDSGIQYQLNIPSAQGPEIVSASDVNITFLTHHRRS